MLCTCTNEWIYSTDNFSNQAVVDFKIQSSHTEKAPKNDRQKQTSMYRVFFFFSLCLQTNRKHMENQSLICTRKTLFYTDNITSTLTIVVFSINWSRMFALYVRQMCCKLELKTLNNRKNDSIALESAETSRVFRSMNLHYTAILVFFQQSFCLIVNYLHKIRSFWFVFVRLI